MKNFELIPCNQMILIGAAGRNSGKTTLATHIIQQYKDQMPIIAFKIITVNDHGDICPRGGKGCGICKSLTENFDIIEEINEGKKDTMLLKKAGATKVYLVRAFKEHLREAIMTALTYVPSNALIICESNTLRHIIKPACFIIIHSNINDIKPSAASVLEYADYVIDKGTNNNDFVQDSISRIISNIASNKKESLLQD